MLPKSKSHLGTFSGSPSNVHMILQLLIMNPNTYFIVAKVPFYVLQTPYMNYALVLESQQNL